MHGSDSFLVHQLTNQLGGHAGATAGKAQHSILTTDKGVTVRISGGFNLTTQRVFNHGLKGNSPPGGYGFGFDQ